MAQWITRLTTDQKILGSTPGWLVSLLTPPPPGGTAFRHPPKPILPMSLSLCCLPPLPAILPLAEHPRTLQRSANGQPQADESSRFPPRSANLGKGSHRETYTQFQIQKAFESRRAEEEEEEDDKGKRKNHVGLRAPSPMLFSLGYPTHPLPVQKRRGFDRGPVKSRKAGVTGAAVGGGPDAHSLRSSPVELACQSRDRQERAGSTLAKFRGEPTCCSSSFLDKPSWAPRLNQLHGNTCHPPTLDGG